MRNAYTIVKPIPRAAR